VLPRAKTMCNESPINRIHTWGTLIPSVNTVWRCSHSLSVHSSYSLCITKFLFVPKTSQESLLRIRASSFFSSSSHGVLSLRSS
jgi:hypothetical protein